MSRQRSIAEHKVVVDRDVRIAMRDGALLAADVYRPDGSGEYPVLIERTPYSKAESSETNQVRCR
jgi:predicted acyl esterase